MDRRKFLALLGTSASIAMARGMGFETAPDNPKADVTLHISPVELEVAPRRTIKTTGYNGSAPGPVLRLREGQPVTVDVFNETKIPELVHWHGLFVPSGWMVLRKKGRRWYRRVGSGGIRSSPVPRELAGITATFMRAGI